jgi:hypothetical protein
MNAFDLDTLTAKNMLERAMLNPATTESIDVSVFDYQLKLALLVGGIVVVLLVSGGLMGRRYGLRPWRWVGGLIGVYVLAGASGLWVSMQKNQLAQASLEAARAEAAANYKPEPFRFPPMTPPPPPALVVVPSKSLMPEAPRTTTIDLNCSSISPSAISCSGTSPK